MLHAAQADGYTTRTCVPPHNNRTSLAPALTLCLALDPVRISLGLWLFPADAYDATVRGDNHGIYILDGTKIATFIPALEMSWRSIFR